MTLQIVFRVFLVIEPYSKVTGPVTHLVQADQVGVLG